MSDSLFELEQNESSVLTNKNKDQINPDSKIFLPISTKDMSTNITLYFHKLNPKQKFEKIKSEKNIVILPHESVKFLSYNFTLNKSPSSKSSNSNSSSPTLTEERINSFISQMENFDIICLQSVSSYLSNSQQDLEQGAMNNGLYFSVKSPQVSTYSYFQKDNGLMIFSRFPIDKWAYVPFTSGSFNDKLSENGLLYAKIKVGKGYLHVINVLLQSNSFDSSKYKNSESINKVLTECRNIRGQQFNDISDFIEECIFNDKEYRESDYVLLCGNFNIDRNGYSNLRGVNFVVDGSLKNEYDELLNKGRGYKMYNIIDGVGGGLKNYPTYGAFKEDGIFENYLTDTFYQKSKMTLDYAFYVTMDSDKENGFNVNYDTVKIEEFPVMNMDMIFLSDHFGISFEILYDKEFFEKVSNEINNEVEVPFELANIV